MKKLSIIFALIFGFNLVYAQTGVQINFDQLKKNVEKSNADIENPKKNIKEGTWIDRAELMMEVYESQLLNTTAGMDITAFTMLAGQPKNRVSEEQNGTLVEKFIMERAIFYFVNNALERWEVLNPVVENPLEIAFQSLKKAQEIDVKGKKTKKIAEEYVRLKKRFIAEASNCYSFKNYVGAYNNFNSNIIIGSLPQVNAIDTAIVYYGAVAAQLANKQAESIDLYKKAIELGYTADGNAYSYLNEAYKAVGDSLSGVTYLEQGFTKYPKNQGILFALIGVYSNDPSKVFNYIDKSINEDPSHASILYFAKGTMYDKLNNSEKAIESYQKAIEIDPKFFDPYFNISAVYYNKGVKLLEEANKVPAKDIEKYDGLIAKANEEFKKALPFILKAYEIKPEDRSTVETLKNIYFRYRRESEEMNKKYEEFNEKLQNLK